MKLLLLFTIVLVLSNIALARKVKRKESYLNVPPPPPKSPTQPPVSAPSAHPAEPYQYEEVQHQHQHEYPTHAQISRYEDDYSSHAHAQVHVHSHSQGHAHSTASGGNFLIDNGLRSIAKGSADQANSAVASQNAAGKQAAYVAKSTLAQAAAQAAGTAIAVLKGKEVLLRRLEEQSNEAHKSMEGELAQLQQAKRSAKTAQYAAQQSINHVSVLTAALNNAQSSSELAQKAASEAAAELASQIDMVAQAKAKLEQVEANVYTARLDYEETKEAAEKATHSAQEAQINANDAAVHANVELSEAVQIALDKSDRGKEPTQRVHVIRHSYGQN